MKKIMMVLVLMFIVSGPVYSNQVLCCCETPSGGMCCAYQDVCTGMVLGCVCK